MKKAFSWAKAFSWKKLAYLLTLLNLAFVFSVSRADTLVETASITDGAINNSRIFIGSIHFVQSSVLASKTQGMVLKVNFDTTSRIRKDDILVELDHEILDSRIKAIQASLKELKLLEEKSAKDLRRYIKLLQQKNVSQQKYDEIYYEKSRLDQKLISSQAELDALLIEREQNIIIAPFDGVITQRHVELGEWVDTGGKIATLVNPKKIIALFDIPASYATKVQPGQKIMVDVASQPQSGIIEGVIITGDTKSRTFPLKINLENSAAMLFEGMEAQISLSQSSSPDSLLVPRDAIIKRFGNEVIFVVENNKAKMYPVNVQIYDGSMAAITLKQRVQKQKVQKQTAEEQNTVQKLTAGMQVITKGNERIFPDQAVKLK